MAPPPHAGRLPARIPRAMDLRLSALSAVAPIAIGGMDAMGAMKISDFGFRISNFFAQASDYLVDSLQFAEGYPVRRRRQDLSTTPP